MASIRDSGEFGESADFSDVRMKDFCPHSYAQFAQGSFAPSDSLRALPMPSSPPPLCLLTEENAIDDSMGIATPHKDAVASRPWSGEEPNCGAGAEKPEKSSRPKKKDFFNRGRGIVPSDYNTNSSDSFLSLDLNPSSFYSQPGPSQYYRSDSEFQRRVAQSESPPPLCPINYSDDSQSPGSVQSPIIPSNSMREIESPESSLEPWNRQFSFPAQQPTGWLYKSDGNYGQNEGETSGEQQKTPKRRQKCSLCFNHGIISEKKGHKGKCSFINCECKYCIITKGRQETMKQQQKITRNIEKMRMKQFKQQ